MLNEVTITRAPQSFWSNTTIMPVDRETASKLDCIVHQLSEDCRCLSWGQPKIIGIKQSGIHCMQRQLEQSNRLERLVGLRRTRSISHRFVVANRRVVGRSSLLQDHWRLLVVVEPVDPYADLGCPCQAPNLF